MLALLESFSFRLGHKIRAIGNITSRSIGKWITYYHYFLGPMNSVCHKTAACAYTRESKHDSWFASTSYSKASLLSNLKDYSNGEGPGARGPKKNSKRINEAHFNVSVTHEICNFGDWRHLKEDLQCAFHSDRLIKQLLIVRYYSQH